MPPWFKIILTACLLGIVKACLERIPTVGEKPLITLEEANWSSHIQNNWVARIILEELLGYPVAVLPTIANEGWDYMVNGSLDVNLEVWADGAGVGQPYLTYEGGAEKLGYLGVFARVGWYIPKWMVDEYPSLETWNGLRDPTIVELFKTNTIDFEPDPTRQHGVFYAGTTSWNEGEQEQLVENLELDLEVYHEEDYDRFLGGIVHALENHKPILFYFWVPHEIFAKYQLHRIALPPYIEGTTRAKKLNGTLDCDYEPDLLLKAASITLIHRAPEAYYVLRSFTLTADDQAQMLSEIAYNNRTPYEAACLWVTGRGANQWPSWISPSFYLKEICPSGMENKGYFVSSSNSSVSAEVSTERATFCGPCEPGYYREYTNSSKLTSCQPCNYGSYASIPGSFECTKCPVSAITNRTGAVHSAECVCEDGYYTSPTNQSEHTCQQCPTGGRCAGGELLPIAAKGYWANKDAPYDFYKCRSEENCPGAKVDSNRTTMSAASPCGDGYAGELCADCSEGYGVNGNQCVECEVAWMVIGVLGIIGVLAIVPVGFFLFYDSSRDRRMARTARETEHWPLLAQVVTYTQLLAVLLARGQRNGMDWVPGSVNWIKQILRVVGASVLSAELFHLGCALKANFYQLFVARLLVPTGLFLFVPLILAALLTRVARMGWVESVSGRSEKIRGFVNKLVVLVLVLEGFWYVPLVSTTLEVFQCYGPQPVDGSYRLIGDATVVCYTSDGTWPAMLAISIVAFCIHGLAYPLCIGVLLKKAPQFASVSKDFLERFGLLFRPFKPNLWWWHSVQLGRKLLLSIFIPAISLSSSLEIAIALLVVGVGVGMQLAVRPYYHNMNNRMEVFMFGLFCINLLCALALSDNDIPFGVKTVFQCVFLVSAVLAVCGGFGRFAWEYATAKGWTREWRRRWSRWRNRNVVSPMVTETSYAELPNEKEDDTDNVTNPVANLDKDIHPDLEEKLTELMTPANMTRLAIYGSEDDFENVVQISRAVEEFRHHTTLAYDVKESSVKMYINIAGADSPKPKKRRWLLPSTIVPRWRSLKRGMDFLRAQLRFL